MEITCEHCGKTVKKTHRTQRFCSTQCIGKSRRKPDPTCEQCGKTFRRRLAGANRFCSRACLYEANKTVGEYKPCPGCGKMFWVKDSFRVTCSSECHKAIHSIALRCEQCGKPITKDMGRARKVDRHFCSRSCYGQWHKGPNAVNWRGGHDRWRGPNWDEARRKTRERDGDTCQLCGKTAEVNGRAMDVHHIVSFMEFDGDYEAANAVENLTCLCRSCHCRLDRTKKREIRVIHGVHPSRLEPAKITRTADRTHCVHGHEYTEANTYIAPSGRRFCRACNTIACQRYHANHPASSASSQRERVRWVG